MHNLVMYCDNPCELDHPCSCSSENMQEDDLVLLCKRHATSKLQSFEDLNGIGTLGFRGEALASISCMAHLSVITRHTGSAAGVKANYRCNPCYHLSVLPSLKYGEAITATYLGVVYSTGCCWTIRVI